MNELLMRNYRRYAADCLALAEKMGDPNDRTRLIEMAAGWYDLAASLEKHDAAERPRLRPMTFSLSSAAVSGSPE